MSYCAARLHAISGRPRSSRGDTIPSCPQRSRRNRMNNPAWGPGGATPSPASCGP
ncbi:MAG: hypothetical protein V3T81_08800 [Thermoanaerobaculia bacterium]